ncbi:hypothetical protein AAG570_003784 [Ranatra chinensis]|uniref:Uncharacterized protein n=1 Tax=Ranatra chinensis TaxID=642074 RepID=A0ABD0Y5T5_9HEMI
MATSRNLFQPMNSQQERTDYVQKKHKFKHRENWGASATGSVSTDVNRHCTQPNRSLPISFSFVQYRTIQNMNGKNSRPSARAFCSCGGVEIVTGDEDESVSPPRRGRRPPSGPEG